MRKAVLDTVLELARRDERVVYIGSDLGAGTMDGFKKEFPGRFFMEGISEANIIGMAAGMAMDGYIPYVNTIATFLTRRCFEQVAVDLCLHNLPVRLIANGGGLVYAPLGPTHIAMEDIALMRALPHMTIMAPSDAQEMRWLTAQTLELPGPAYIRLGKGGDAVVSRNAEETRLGQGILHGPEQSDIVIATTGVMRQRCLEAAETLQATGLKVSVCHFHTVKPLDAALLERATAHSRLVVTVEEHTRIGGLGSAVLETLADRTAQPVPHILRLGLDDKFSEDYGSQEHLMQRANLHPAGLVSTIQSMYSSIAGMQPRNRNYA
jgi:transketolase